MATYRSVSGDMVDAICTLYYPNVAMDQALTAVLSANPGLAAYGPQLPEGLEITLPEISTNEVATTIQLWD